MISKKNSCKPLLEEKNCMQHINEIEKNSCTAASKKKKCCKAISSFQGDFTKSQQNCNHSSLAPFKLWSWICFRMCNAFLALFGHIASMFKFEVLNLEVDGKKAEQKLLKLFFKLDRDQLTSILLSHLFWRFQSTFKL